jgi:hypothetical protein
MTIPILPANTENLGKRQFPFGEETWRDTVDFAVDEINIHAHKAQMFGLLHDGYTITWEVEGAQFTVNHKGEVRAVAENTKSVDLLIALSERDLWDVDEDGDSIIETSWLDGCPYVLESSVTLQHCEFTKLLSDLRKGKVSA